MLFANTFHEVIGTGALYSAMFIALIIICTKKFFGANPEVKDAAKKAAAAKAIQLISRLFK